MKTVQMHMELKEEPHRPDLSSADFIAARLAESPTGDIRLMESICERGNMRKALRRVEKNKGAPGVAGNLGSYFLRIQLWIPTQAVAETGYNPMPTLR